MKRFVKKYVPFLLAGVIMFISFTNLMSEDKAKPKNENKKSSKSDKKEPLKLKDSDVIAKFKMNNKDKLITYADYKNELKNAVLPMPKNMDKREKETIMEKIIKEMIAKTIIADQAIKEKLDQDRLVIQSINAEFHNAVKEKINSVIANEAPKPSEEEIKKYYDENKNKFTIMEHYKIKFIYSYCGEPEKKDKMAEAKKKAEEALKKVKEGMDFAQIAKDYSNAPTPNDGKDIIFISKEINPKIEEAVKSLKKDEISNLIEVKNGYIIVKLIDHIDEKIVPLDEVKDKIIKKLNLQNENDYVNNYWTEYAKKLNIKKNYDLLKGKEIKYDAVVFEFGDFKFTYSDLKKQTDAFDQYKVMMRVDVTQKVLVDTLAEQQLRLYDLRKRGLDKDPEMLNNFEIVKKNLLYEEKMKELVDKKIKVTPEEIQDYYQKNKDKFMSSKLSKIFLIRVEAVEEDGKKRAGMAGPTKKALAKAFWKAQDAYNKIKNGENLDKILKEYSSGKNDGTLDFSDIQQRDSLINSTADKLKIGEVSNPVQHFEGFYIIKLLDVKEPTQLSFEESKARIDSLLKDEKKKEMTDKIINDSAAQHNLVIKQDLEKLFDSTLSM